MQARGQVRTVRSGASAHLSVFFDCDAPSDPVIDWKAKYSTLKHHQLSFSTSWGTNICSSTFFRLRMQQAARANSMFQQRNKQKLTLDDGQGAPLKSSPVRAQKPLLHFSHQLCKVLRIRLHYLVKLGKLSWPKEDFC